MIKPIASIKKVSIILTLGLTISTSACNDHPKQQTGEVAIDTTAGQDELFIDTTCSVSYGKSGDVTHTESPDLDTLKYIDKGEKPENAFK